MLSYSAMFCERQSWEKIATCSLAVVGYSALLRVLLHMLKPGRTNAWHEDSLMIAMTSKTPEASHNLFPHQYSSGSRKTRFHTDMATPVAQLRSTYGFGVVVTNISRESTLY